MKLNIPLFKNYHSDNDIEMVTKVIKRGMYWANGPEVQKFEEEVADYVGVKYALAFNSGTSALHAVLLAYGIGDGDEVIVPSFTFIATANAVIMTGAKPVFADVEEQTFALDPMDVAKKITEKTKAIMPVHFGGCPALNIAELEKLAQKHNVFLIEDAAESLGSKLNSRFVGAFGQAAMFSFTPSKIISTGEGGIIVTNSLGIIEKLKLVRSHGRDESENYFSSIKSMDYIELGYNFRLPSICAAQGLAQMNKIEKIISRRRRLAKIYSQGLSKIKAIIAPSQPEGSRHVYQMYVIRVTEGRKKRDSLQQYLHRQGISSRVYFEPIHLTHYYQVLGYQLKLEKTERLASQVLSIPIFPDLTDKEQEYIIQKIRNFFNKKG